ncbi:hypothetical protein [Nonomuraea sp. 10N515B]|uniref:hypothetical protein n=1 Tax=Nonomuraea sp. 10N515B TaxID=3457422 RepID=UPI003FCC9C68
MIFTVAGVTHTPRAPICSANTASDGSDQPLSPGWWDAERIVCRPDQGCQTILPRLASTTMKRMQRIGAAIASAAFVTSGTFVAPAQAAAAYVETECFSGKYRASLRAYYYAAGDREVFNRLNWYSSGPSMGTNNTVRIRAREDKPWGPDWTIKEWKLKTRKGSGGRSINVPIKTWSKYPYHFDLAFTFDLPGNSYRTCNSRTRSL